MTAPNPYDPNAPMRCSKCETKMIAKIITREVPIAGVTFSVTMPGWECPVESNWAVGPAALRVMYSEALRRVAMHGPATGVGLRFMRGKLSLTTSELAKLLGVSGEEIERSESGELRVSALLWHAVSALILEQLDVHASTRTLLAATNDPASEPIPLDLRSVAA